MSKSNWFYKLFEFNESLNISSSSSQKTIDNKINKIKQNLILSTTVHKGRPQTVIQSTINNKKYLCGNFNRVSLGSLKEVLQKISLQSSLQSPGTQSLVVSHIVVDDILEMHYKNPDSLFQVASQFNCLEFTNIKQIPEFGVTMYEYDHTQGPACAIACGPATVYRNYFVDGSGQSKDSQINNLDSLEEYFEETYGKQFWDIVNGHLLSDVPKLTNFYNLVRDGSIDLNVLKNKIKVGFSANPEVVFCSRNPNYIKCSFQEPITVSQIFCSAIPISYNDPDIPIELWKPLAKTILETNYEICILLAILDSITRGAPTKLFLTFIGGGAFGNPKEWISESIQKSINNVRKYLNSINVRFDITVYICHYMILDSKFSKIF